MHKHIPESYLVGGKRGFAVPLANWLRGPLKQWGEDLIYADDSNINTYLNSNMVIQIWEEHQSGKNDWKSLLWKILVFKQWLNTV